MTTNKQPMLIDSPLRESITLGEITCLSAAGNWNTPAALGLKLLCSGGEDGALLDSISFFTTQAGTSVVNVLCFITRALSQSLIAPDNTRLVAWAPVSSSGNAGDLTRVPLPALLVPVPVARVQIGATPSEDDRKNTGILLEAGQSVYAGVDVAITAPSASSRLIVNTQGGYY